jgi:predicted nucleic acid-binding protein
MRVADTSALYALFAADDAHHEAARAAFANAQPILLPAEILVETLGLIAHRSGRKMAHEAARFLRQLPHVEIQPTPDEPWDDIQGAAWSAFEAGLPYPEAIVAAWCRKRGLASLTFDSRLERLTRPARAPQ